MTEQAMTQQQKAAGPTPTDKPILNRENAAALLGITVDRLASIEANDPDLVRAAGVRLTYSGRPTIRYRRAALLAWLEGRTP